MISVSSSSIAPPLKLWRHAADLTATRSPRGRASPAEIIAKPVTAHMPKNIDRDIIPLLIANLLVLTSIGIILSTDYSMTNKHYVGSALILISTFLYFTYKKVYIYIFGLTLIIGTLNLIEIFYASFIFGIGPIEFNPIFLTLLIMFLAFNRKLIDQMFPEKLPTEKSVADKIAEKEKLIKSYERKFQSKTESELIYIADEKSEYVTEAKIASKNILRELYVL